MKRSIYLKQKRGYWYAELQYLDVDEDGNDKVRARWIKLDLPKGASRRSADRALEVVRRSVEEQLEKIKSGTRGKIPVEEYAESYLQTVKLSVKPATFRSYRLWIGEFCSIYGGVPLNEITPDHIERFKRALIQSRKPATVNIALRSLKAMFSDATKKLEINTNPSAAVRPLDPAKPEFPPYWTPEQFATYLTFEPRQRLRASASLAFYAGLRLREASNLRWDDVQLYENPQPGQACGVVRIVSGEGFRTKTDKGRRVPLYSSLLRELEQLERASPYVLSITPGAANPWYFSKQFTYTLRRANKELSKPLPEITFHGLRHSFATMIAPNVEISVLQKLLGHSQITTTMIYTHVQSDVALDYASQIDL